VAVAVGTTNLLVPAVALVVVVVERARYKRSRHPIKETLEARVNKAAMAMAVAVAVGALGPLVQQVQTNAVEMAVAVLTTPASSEQTWVGTTEDLLVEVQALATEMMQLQSRRAALEGEEKRAAAT
jgi:hypothetical protein